MSTGFGIPKDFNAKPKSFMSIQSTAWALQLLKIDNAHYHGAKGDNVKISIGDTGVNPDHHNLPDIKKSYQGTHETDIDKNGHGSHVLGIAFSVAPNAEYLVGKVMDDNGSGDFDNLVDFIYWSVDEGARVINLSVGNSHIDSHPELDKAIDYAYSKGVLIVAAAGNSDSSKIDYPGSNEKVLAVGAIDANKIPATFQNTGMQLDFVAPGVNIFSAWVGQESRYADGTSQASPYITGLCALIIGDYYKTHKVYPSINELVNILKINSEDLGKVGFDIETGYGLPTSSGNGQAFRLVGEPIEKPESTCDHGAPKWWLNLYGSMSHIFKEIFRK